MFGLHFGTKVGLDFCCLANPAMAPAPACPSTMPEMDPPTPMIHNDADDANEADDAHGVVHNLHKTRMSVAQRRQLRLANRKTKQVCAVRGYEAFHMLPAGSATTAQVRMSSGGINGYVEYDHRRNLDCDHSVSKCHRKLDGNLMW